LPSSPHCNPTTQMFIGLVLPKTAFASDFPRNKP
jgi:hypothetical protein